MGKLYVVGIGPGSLEHITVKARKVLEESDIIVGYSKYIDYVKPLIEGKEVHTTGMKKEEERCQRALDLSKDKVVSVISTGDAGIYGMAGLILEMNKDKDLEIEIIPGVTASTASASIIGAPLMHDNCNISLSDLMTPYELIKKRVKLAAEGDFVISLYNPKSKGRPYYLKECMDIIKEYRRKDTPVAVVKNALREGEEIRLYTLENFTDDFADMLSTVIIGNSSSFMKEGKFITRRGYKVHKD
ncbi:precorrin-3B C(17)-methyltransferase [Clostridium botulinum]|uniref:Precorrin-3B C(17)-methyltransferase n=2 Tax=Clostridium botulinum TaxID=1491 RepID=A0A846HXC7_CLOBO|nr:precorrin-3B C(17)-methyltransferase [Clostridium botulinum]ACQ55164.1 precorrin-3B C(17)-methyltransferase [Clostridium botulinum Ba4 str. 657]AJE12884.1 precorrin-3B C17-methyltransferase [Clostridium botulinum CDC_1436]AXG91864.1 precorrin-3B C(17)-methyltransferase [Clostridium botulinum]MBY6758507.1 precorrin-3B C(17)-methyltransferase [Clostridium botulinum]NEZ91882.1 precorrin-3B C(17)-methyltransferase [Clostridium botulinum]